MKGFLANLARRGAGLPAKSIQAPATPLFGELLGPQPGIAEMESVSSPQHRAGEGFAAGALAPAALEVARVQAPATSAIPPATQVQLAMVGPPPIGRAPTPPPIPAESAALKVGVARLDSAEGADPLREEVALAPRLALEISDLAPGAGDVMPGKQDPRVEADVRAPTIEAVENVRPGSLAPALVSVKTPVSPSTGVVHGPRGRQVPMPTILPAPVHAHPPLSFPMPTSLFPGPSVEPLPIHVRIGRVEVRPAPAPATAPAITAGVPARVPQGFARYQRVRTYRS